jgi:Electron transfer DM13
MYKLLIFIALIAFSPACSKDADTASDDITLAPDDVVLSSGSFVSGAHATSGTVKLIKSKNGDKFLILENFKFDSGPDLRLYLSTSKKDDNYTEITGSPALGNVKLPVPSSADTDTQKYLLLWCEQFSVLFGHAAL